MCLVCSEHSLRAQTTDSNGSMQRACLPPADYKTTTLPPRSSGRQHHARLAGSRCAMPDCFYRILRSITRPRDRIIRAQDSSEPVIGNSQHQQHIHKMQRACVPPTDYKTTPCRSAAAAGSAMHARVAGPRCPMLVPFIGACDRSPHHTTTFTTARCV